MAEPVLAETRLAGTAGDTALLVVEPSLGTAVAALWERCAAGLGGTSPADADDESYALACEVLAGFDRRRHLGRMRIPFLLGPGQHDGVVPPARVPASAHPARH